MISEGKLIVVRDGLNSAHLLPNLFFTEADRLIIGTSCSRVDLMLELAKPLSESFVFCYEVRSERGGFELGAYQSDALSFAELSNILCEFKGLIERDARHHTYIFPQGVSALIVYDEHDLLYAYGDLDSYRNFLIGKGFVEDFFELPFPHIHAYMDEMDEQETQLMKSHCWTFAKQLAQQF